MNRTALDPIGPAPARRSFRQTAGAAAVKFQWAIVACLLVIFAAELYTSVSRLSQTFDEGDHLYAGYRYWQARDFGINPEHPPLVKLVAALPLLAMHLKQPQVAPEYFKLQAGDGGLQLLYRNDADSVLFRARVAASTFAILLGLLLYLATREMFGVQAGISALLLYVFEPNFLAHGALVTTDLGETCFLFASVYTFYRWMQQPGGLRLFVCGVACALALAAKHTGVLVFPILICCATADFLFVRAGKKRPRLGPLVIAIAALVFIAVFGLWSFYTFRFSARPPHVAMIPSFQEFSGSLRIHAVSTLLLTIAHTHLVPEAYLYGVTDILKGAGGGRPMSIMGRVYPVGQWFFFPLTFLVKSTLPFLLLLALSPFAQTHWWSKWRRELLFLLVPVAVYGATCINSKLDLGVRHLLPIFPFLLVLAGTAAWRLSCRARGWTVAVSALFLFHAGTSLAAFPNYISYANESLGGRVHAARMLSDSNMDWGQSLKQAGVYLAQHHETQCWIGWYDGFVPPAFQHVNCKPLPLSFFHYAPIRVEPAIEPALEGTFVLGATELAGAFWGPGVLNPYRQFASRKPDDMIGNSMFVYRGRFDFRELAALGHISNAEASLVHGDWPRAGREAAEAGKLAPELAESHAAQALFLYHEHRDAEADREAQTAMEIVKRVEPAFQSHALGLIYTLAKRPKS